ncbi:hypothetical protein OEB94_03010 [Streptomyces sp. ICN988]|nr:hypothetical protein [Streptomyces sp. ICN988]MCV2458254.1 hypothetical protein [Streptomyces sp. ICN988]
MVEFAGAGLSAGVVDVGDLVDVVTDPGQSGSQGGEFVDGGVESFVGVQCGRTAGGGEAGCGEESGDGDAALCGSDDDFGVLGIGEAGGRLAGALARVTSAAARCAVGEGGRAGARLLAVVVTVGFSSRDRRPLVPVT